MECAKLVNIYANVRNLAIKIFDNNINIPNSVTNIGRYAFRGTNISKITIPNSVKRIEYETFSYCDKLITVIIPDSLTFIDKKHFINAAIWKM